VGPNENYHKPPDIATGIFVPNENYHKPPDIVTGIFVPVVSKGHVSVDPSNCAQNVDKF